ncbi:hypothetical protein J7E83_00855 [Arthrobacter sp. ISL-48]|uniref:hypothetical protein n=1 Tax=Arthrobacter sp. ISL-48 TaxID=2819110 RepID=UPI001BE8074F|nr:hypothetical protein [Arthrobacter sp. ISL-48]MBT2530692.1 hypothetical protein [Arthrobacter sp. ISL-48]
MNSLFFWIIVLSFVIPMAMRMYRKSVHRRNQEQSFSGRYPEQFPGADRGPQSSQPRDGYTQQDYMAGGFRQIGSPQPLPPAQPLPPSNEPFPPYDQPMTPQEQAPEQGTPQQPAAPVTPPPPSAPQGYRARKLAELDQQYSNGELAMEDYMARRAEIMNG